MVMPCSAIFCITSSTSPIISGSSALVGSSNKIALGFIAKLRAIATRCCCPPESSPGKLSALFSRPTIFNRSCASCSTSCLFRFRTKSGPKVTFCNTFLLAYRLKCWKTIPTFLRMRFISVFLSARSKSFTISCPDVIRSSPLMQRSKVLLPDPDGPMMVTTSPRSTVRLIFFKA